MSHNDKTLKTMSFLNIFKSRSEKEKLSHLKTLLAVMGTDGKVDPNELKMLEVAIEAEGLDREAIERIINNPESVDFVVPKSQEDKKNFLAETIGMMLIDGEITEDEKNICMQVGRAYGFTSQQVEQSIVNVTKQFIDAFGTNSQE